MTVSAAIYVRVSTKSQASADKVSLAQQEADCRAYCESKGYEVVAVFSDIGSGATKRRPQFQRLLNEVREGAVDVVVGWAVDRLSRSIYATAALMEALEGRDCRVECARESVDLDMLALHAAVGQVELRRIRERTSMGKRGAAMAGRLPSGRSVYGYRAGPDRKPETDPEEAPVVGRLFEEYATGSTTNEIAAGLDADGILPRRGGRWNAQYVAIRLRDATYIGHGYWGKERYQRTEAGRAVRKLDREQWIDLPHPVLIDEALFAYVQERLKSRRTFCPRRPETSEFLLRHLLRCDECGRNFTCRAHSKYARRYYECMGTFRHGTECRKPRIIGAQVLEETVWRHVVAWVSNPDLLEEAVQSQVRGLQERGAYADLQEMRRSLRSLTLEEDRIVAAYGRQRVTEQQMGRHLRRLSERREHYEQRIAVLETEAKQTESQLARMGDFRELCSDIVPRLDTLSFDERMKLVRAVVDGVTIDGENNVRIDIAIYPERLPTDGEVVTNANVTLWPEIATRCEVPVAFRSFVRPAGMAERWPRKIPWASAACGSGSVRASASPRRPRTEWSAASACSPWPVAMVRTSG